MLQQILLCISLGTVCLFSLFAFSDDSSSSLTYNSLILKRQQTLAVPRLPNENVLIYVATTYFGFDLPSIEKSFLKNCPKDIQDYCTISSYKNDIPYADAILYHNRDFREEDYVKDPSKIQIMFTSESQQYESILFKPGMINWTNTFKRDSEIFSPYGQLQRLSEGVNFEEGFAENDVDMDAIWNMKNQNLTSTWLASNCDAMNRRTELIINAQKKGLSLDIYGDCGMPLPNCGRLGAGHYNCAVDTIEKYKFYFAFENSNCVDYLSEKFWNSLRMYKAVPIVIQRKLLTDLGIPGDTFIALDDFFSMQEMVDFLIIIKEDKKRYLSYHQWRKYYKVQVDDSNGFCDMCKRLKQRNEFKPHVYNDLKEWFSPETNCDNSYADHYLH